jgi:subtilisin family serine protease
MQPGKSPRGAWLASLAVAALCALAPTPAGAAVGSSGDGALSPRLAELAKPAVRSAPPREQADALSLAADGPGSLIREGNRVVVEVRFDRGAAAGVEDLRQAGAKVVGVSPRYQTVTVAAKPGELPQLADLPRVGSVAESLRPIVYASCPSGATVSEGDSQLEAAEARSKFGVDGSGVTVGVLSDSFDRDGSAATHASDDVTSGDLPGSTNPCGLGSPVDTLEDSEANGADEGRAMAQIVHDLAPGARLAFATAFFESQLPFAENIERLAAQPAAGGAGANVIVDDVFYFSEPFFQEGPVAVAAQNVSQSGVAYFSAAGNDNLIDESGNDIASWEAPAFRDSLGCPPLLVAATGAGTGHCMDFDPSSGEDDTFGITVEEGETLTVDLQWTEPWFGVETDLDVFLLNAAGEPLEEEVGGESFLVGSTRDNPSTQTPFEFFQWENPGPEQEVQLAINRCFSAACNPGASETSSPGLKFGLLENGRGVSGTEYPESPGVDVVGPTVFGHSGAKSAISVAAVPSPLFPLRSTGGLEDYSSRGPVTNYFGPVLSSTPAAKLEPPEVISKPDLAATDCGVTTFFSFESAGKWRFCGTSAAAPHAAAVAALMLERDPSLSPSQLHSTLAGSARPVGAFGPDAVGAGLVDATGALALLTGEGGEGGEGGSGGASSTFTLEPQPTSPDIAETRSGRPAPYTFLRKRPAKLILTRRRGVKRAFRFGSDQGGVSFLCKVDRQRFRRCRARFVRRYSLGWHVLRVKARRNSDGATDATPAVYRFRVKRVRHGAIKRRHTRHHRRD